jgi:Zn-dependent peptidase ImmA (M78 family)
MSPRRRGAPRDPDIVALIEAAGGLADPRSLVINQARDLNRRYREWCAGSSSPLERLKQLASLRGFKVEEMVPNSSSQRDAMIFMADSTHGQGGQIFYDPTQSPGRAAFSIAHEIAHSFFPSTSGGARFREMMDDNTREPNELELLCHAGAAELLMPIEEFRTIVGLEWSIRNVPKLVARFGASFEATVFRLASAHPRIAVAGTAYFRRTKGDEANLRSINLASQSSLFEFNFGEEALAVSPPKYRRQSLHLSENCPKDLVIPFNKSFDLNSCVYRIDSESFASATEALPVRRRAKGRLEAVDAPYQRSNADSDHPDILFLWEAA